MADAVHNGSNCAGNQNEAKPEVLPKCSPRYHSTIIPHLVKSGRAYASNMVSSQKNMLEHLRYVRAQLDREERQLRIMQASIGYRKEIRSMPNKYEATILRRHFDDD